MEKAEIAKKAFLLAIAAFLILHAVGILKIIDAESVGSLAGISGQTMENSAMAAAIIVYVLFGLFVAWFLISITAIIRKKERPPILDGLEKAGGLISEKARSMEVSSKIIVAAIAITAVIKLILIPAATRNVKPDPEGFVFVFGAVLCIIYAIIPKLEPKKHAEAKRVKNKKSHSF